jgi:DNA-binding cell septation regulator SpoVG
MTAIAIVSTEKGFVLAADGRRTLDESFRSRATPAQLARESELVQKIFSATHDDDIVLAYALTGTVANDDNLIDLVKEAAQ